MEEIRKWVKDQYQVKLLTLSSFEATTILNHSSLTPEDLLNPFCEISHTFSVKSLTRTLNCSNFKVQVFEKVELKKNDGILNTLTPKVEWQGGLNPSAENLQTLLSSETTPWFHSWKDDYLKSLNFSPHELIDMPLGIIYMASTTDTDPLQTFQTLSRTQGLPPLYYSKIYDSNVPKIFLLIHDPQRSQLSPAQVNSLHEKIQKVLTPCLCYCQSINSEGQAGELLWGEKEKKFTQDERLKLQITINEIIVRAIVPYVEASLKSLDMILEQKKRGIKNSISKFFSKKDKPEAFSFQVGCIEHVSRLLADLAFLFGDYEEAMSHYKAVCNDLKNLKAWSHAGSAYEMMAFCSVMSSNDLREAEFMMDTAYSFYQKSGDQALLVRCLLFYRQLFDRPEYGKKIAQKLIATSNDVKEIKAVYPLLMEQTAICYLMSSPSYYRKYAFYKVIAGDEYRKLELVTHALNCYYSASHIYKGKKWEHIEMHIQNMLGRFCYYLNMQIESVHFYLKLTSSPKLLQQRDQHQKKVINELLATVSQWTSMPIPADFNPITKESIKFHTDGRPILEFSLPKITSYSILLPQDRVHPTSKTQGSFEPWKSLLGKTSGFTEDFSLFDGETVGSTNRGLYCGEVLEVVVKCYNPLNFALTAEDLKVFIQQDSGEIIITKAVDKLELNANEEKAVVFDCVQEKPGKIRLESLKWSFGNAFYGCFRINSPEFLVYPPVSGILAEFLDFPTMLLEGQVRSLQLKLKNQGSNNVNNVKLAFSHGFLFGKGNLDIKDIPAGSEHTIEMWVRGEKIGFHTIRFLITYASGTETRFFRLQNSLEVKPSLKHSTRFDFSLKEINESILQLAIRPAFESCLTIKQISPLSSHNLRLIKDVANEVYFISVKSGEQSSILFDQDWLEPNDMRSGFCWDVKNLLKTGSDEKALDLIVSWELETEQGTVNGHHYLLDLIVNRNFKVFPVHMTLTAPTSVNHRFENHALCKVPVVIKLKNVSESVIENLEISALSEETSRSFAWLGSVSKRINVFQPEETVEIRLEASFQSKGCYNLNRFLIKIKDVPKDLPRYLHQILIS